MFTICNIHPKPETSISTIYLLIFLHTSSSSSKTSCHVLSLQSYLLFIFIINSFVCSRKTFLSNPSCEILCILSHTYSLCNIFILHVHFSFTKYSTCFISLSYNLYSCAHTYHSCRTVAWFNVRTTPSLVIFLRFDLIAHFSVVLGSCSSPIWENLPSGHQQNPLLGLFGNVHVLGSKILFWKNWNIPIHSKERGECIDGFCLFFFGL